MSGLHGDFTPKCRYHPATTKSVCLQMESWHQYPQQSVLFFAISMLGPISVYRSFHLCMSFVSTISVFLLFVILMLGPIFSYNCFFHLCMCFVSTISVFFIFVISMLGPIFSCTGLFHLCMYFVADFEPCGSTSAG
jgi:hypothetical protein